MAQLVSSLHEQAKTRSCVGARRGSEWFRVVSTTQEIELPERWAGVAAPLRALMATWTAKRPNAGGAWL
jgi:hypothetical protein